MPVHPSGRYTPSAEGRALEALRGDDLVPALQTVLDAHGLAPDRRRRPGRAAPRPWRLISMHHRPGAGVTGVYAVRLRRPTTREEPPWPGPVSSARQLEDGEVIMCLSTGAMPVGRLVPLEGSLPTAQAGGPVAAQADGVALTGWLWPQDPWLPALRSSRLLLEPRSALGLELPAAQELLPRAVSYRPTRRAVLRLERRSARADRPGPHGPGGPDPAAWLKIVRPDREAGLIQRHLMARRAGVPAPRPLAATGDGAVLLSHLGGAPVSDPRTAPGVPLEAEHLLALLARLPQAALELPRRLSWTERVLDYARAAAAAVPSEADRVQGLAERIDRARRAGDDEPLVPSHGDLHAGNLMLGGRMLDPALGPITGLLDLDSMGPGRLVDDLGCYTAHRCALLTSREATRDPLGDAGIAADLAVFDRVVEPAALRVRIAGVLLSLVSSAARRGGPEEAQRRLHQAEAVLQQAQRVG